MEHKGLVRALLTGILLGILVLLPLRLPQGAGAQERSRYFPETGKTVSGIFLEYWETHGGLYILGLPITDEFVEDGMRVQYFERAVLEYHRELEGTPFVVLQRLLGSILNEGRDFPPADPNALPPGYRYFPETGHSLGGIFREYWEKNGGLYVFGYPISEEFEELNPADGKVYRVQYFERARFEHHPELAGTPYEVLLGHLGRQYGWLKGVPGIPPLEAPPPYIPPWAQEQAPATPAPTPTPTPAPTPGEAAPTPTPDLSGLQYGFAVHLFYQDYDRVLNLVDQTGFGWVRQQIHWKDIEGPKGTYNWEELDRIVDAVNRHGKRLLLSVVRSPSWAGVGGTNGLPADPKDLQDFLYALVSRYRGKVHAIEVWNEQNYAVENAGRVADPGQYVELLKAAYQGVKAADPNVLVISGAPTPTGVYDWNLAIDDLSYFRMMFTYNGGEMKKYVDGIGVHVAGSNNPPDTLWPENPGPDGWTTHSSFYFRHVENVRKVMEETGFGDVPIWITEFGWSTANQAPGYEYGYQNSEEDQARYLVRAFEIARSRYPWVQAMFVWNLNFATVVPPTDEKGPFGIIRPDWTPRPAFWALVDMPK